MYAINAEATPTESAWEKGIALAKQTIDTYKQRHTLRFSGLFVLLRFTGRNFVRFSFFFISLHGSDELICRTAGITPQELAKARQIEADRNAPKGMMAMMMAAAAKQDKDDKNFLWPILRRSFLYGRFHPLYKACW